MVLKPSEEAPFSAYIWAEIMDAAGVPAGVFNMVNGTGPEVGAAISSHPDIDMVSFTGSTRAGVEVAKAAAPTVKRVAQELGGKSPNIILDDADLQTRRRRRGQHDAQLRPVLQRADPHAGAGLEDGRGHRHRQGGRRADHRRRSQRQRQIGPVVKDPVGEDPAPDQEPASTRARPWSPAARAAGGLDKGFYVKPTVFANVTNDMTIAKEEIFGPVVSILGYETSTRRWRSATTPSTASPPTSRAPTSTRSAKWPAAPRRPGVDQRGGDMNAPFGGYKMSGNGREWGDYGFHEYLEVKSTVGYAPEQAAE